MDTLPLLDGLALISRLTAGKPQLPLIFQELPLHYSLGIQATLSHGAMCDWDGQDRIAMAEGRDRSGNQEIQGKMKMF